MSYSLEIAPAAQKVLDKLEPVTQRRIKNAISALTDNPRPPGYIKMAGRPERYRIRVGDYRIIYKIKDDQLVVAVVEIAPRDKVYKKR